MASIDEKLKRMPRTVRVGVVPGGLSEFITIQAAITWCATQAAPVPSATAPYTVEIYPGIYNEQITCGSWVNLKGIGPKGSVVIYQNDANVIQGLAAHVEIANLTVRLGTPSAARLLIFDGAAGTAKMSDLVMEITTPGNFANEIFSFMSAGDYTIEKCSYNIAGTGVEIGVNNAVAGATIKLICNDFTFTNAAAYHIKSTVAGNWTGGQNRWAGTCGLFNVTLGDIILDGDQHVCTAVSIVAAAANILMREGKTTYHVWPGMDIQHALTAGAGLAVVIHAGAYAPIANLTVSANTLVRGEGKATIITPTGAAITRGFDLNGDNITLKDMKVILAAGAGTAPGFRPNVLYANTRTLLWLENLWLVGDTTVLDDASDVRQDGVCFVTCTYCKIVNCRSRTNKRQGIYLASASNYNTIAGNTCQGNSNGIYLASASSNNTVTGNTCQGDAGGISLVASNNNTVTGNTCQGSISHGIFLSTSSNNNTITGNTCQGNISYGIYLAGSSINNTITGNTCDSNGGAATYSGIYILNSDRNVITGNQCRYNGLHGISIFRSSYCAVTGNGCHANRSGDGINVEGDVTTNSDYNTITGNACAGNADDGIAIEGVGNANKNIVVANQLLGNGGTPLVDNGTLTEVAHNITA